MSDRTFSRRAVLCGAVTGALALSACGFTPAFGPQGGATKLQNAVLVAEPNTRLDFLMVRRLEERLGRPASPAYALDVSIKTDTDGLATEVDGGTTRVQVIGTAVFALKQIGTQNVLTEGTARNFTGYSTTGSTVSEAAARNNAEERLMTILADQIVDRLIIAASDLP